MMNMLLGDSDWETYSFSSDGEDEDYGGHAQNILSSLAESIGKIDNFLAFERGFMHGDIVCSISDPSGQMGKVVDIDVAVDLETMSGDIIKNVNTKELSKLRSFGAGDYVTFGPWLGRVSRVVDLIHILFDDGAKCETAADLENIFPVSPNVLEDVQDPYYAGQRVQIRVPTILKSAKWLCGTWKANRKEGMVSHVEVGSVYVYWVASIFVGCNFNFPTPAHMQDPKNLTLLSCFQYANWQLGDWCSLTSAFFQNHCPGAKNKFSAKKFAGPHRRDPGFDNIFVIVNTKTKVDVIWQDGNLKSGLDSQTLVLANSVGDHDFWPEQFVLEKGNDNLDVSSGQRLGIVKSVDANERTVKVHWMNFGLSQTVAEEIVSAYELIEHPDYNYCLGDVVFRFLPHDRNLEANVPLIQNIRLRENLEEGHIMKMEVTSHQSLGKGSLAENCIVDSPYEQNDYLSCIGNVIGCKDGVIEVKWASGLISKVKPYEIVGIDYNEDPASTPTILEHDFDASACEEMLECEKQSCEEKHEAELEKAVANADKNCKHDWWDARALLFPRAAFGFFTSIASNLFCSYSSTSFSGSNQSNSLSSSRSYCTDAEDSKDSKKYGHFPWEKSSECQIVKLEEVISEANDLELLSQTSHKKEMQEIHLNPEVSPSVVENLRKFKQFDIVDDYSDHHFVSGCGKGSISSQVKRSWLKKVQQEWSLLKRDLPNTIYVRVYEERIDLMRAALVGAPGTPYHNGLFFFDIYLPPDYPLQPPLVHYKSGGLRLNPNLYESGKICLSLLNTWVGTGSEVWNPESSTILQVLLSLQALVLNEKPYFNEAGYDKIIGRPDGEKNSITYNENAFLLSCKSMLYVLFKPPKNFEALVDEHFECHSRDILLACKAYMDGAQVGFAFKPVELIGESHKSCTMGFKIMLSKIVPKLLSAFTEKGIDCHEFLQEFIEVPKPD